MTLADAVWSRVNKTDTCWEWTGTIDADGYGAFGFMCRKRKAHRAAWEVANGPIPLGMCVLHRCDNRRCVRPDHLFLGTQADNLRDMKRKGRNSSGHGERSPFARITADTARTVFVHYAAGVHPKEIAERAGISVSHVYSIGAGKKWARETADLRRIVVMAGR